MMVAGRANAQQGTATDLSGTDSKFGTTVLEVGAAFGMHTELLRLIRLMQESRMGRYDRERAWASSSSNAPIRRAGISTVC
jgi:hypothetical protein